MARLRIFISSTCYDLDILRSELRPFISGLGYEPVMSDYSDVLYDPRLHTHDSCLKEVPSCDMVVLIIGSRFGGAAIPAASSQLDFTDLEQQSTKAEILESRDKLSITQLEALKAVEQSIPVYVFVDDKVMHDHHVYERNKDKVNIIDHIDFPSIQKRDTAKYIFEFINFLTHRANNNGITGFSRLEEIRLHLLSQWSQLFQRLLSEGRNRTQEIRQYRDFSERIEDLKAVVLASITSPDLRVTAKGALQYRHLISFISAFRDIEPRTLLLSNMPWDQLLKCVGISEIRQLKDEERTVTNRGCYLILTDGTFYACRYPLGYIDDMRIDWGNFQALESYSREAIVDALLENRDAYRTGMIKYYPVNFDEHIAARDIASTSESNPAEQS